MATAESSSDGRRLGRFNVRFARRTRYCRVMAGWQPAVSVAGSGRRGWNGGGKVKREL